MRMTDCGNGILNSRFWFLAGRRSKESIHGEKQIPLSEVSHLDMTDLECPMFLTVIVTRKFAVLEHNLVRSRLPD